MGIHLNTYYGPFLIYKPSFRSVERTVRGCKKCNTERDDLRSQYCDKCGAFHADYKKKAKQEHVISDWTKDRLYSPCEINEMSAAIPNFNKDILALRKAGGVAEARGTNDSTMQVWQDNGKAVEEFSNIFSEEIKKLQDWKCFPEVCFGFISYYA